MSVRKASVLELATAAYDLDAAVARGRLARRPDGTWEIGGRSVNDWLARCEGQEVVCIMASLDDPREVASRTCPRCGHDYQGPYCPNCHEARMRLRGS
jgi:hypothetical protein